MSRLEEVKKRRPFEKADLLVYALLILFILAFVLIFTLGRDSGAVEGFYVTCDGETVYTYSFVEGAVVADGWEDRVIQEREGEILTVTVQSDRGYNTVEIDLVGKSAKMLDADCSRHKDCTAMREITARDGVIICVPHALKVLALGGAEDYTRPSIG